MNRKAILAWCLYDWAHAAFNTVVLTFIFAIYVTRSVAADPVAGTAAWASAATAAGLAIALLSPPLGALADQTGRHKPWLGGFLLLGLVATAALWWVEPRRQDLMLALVAVAIAQTAFECANLFYNAQLIRVAPPGRVGLLSGWGWGWGYLGGIVALGIALTGFVQPNAWLGLPQQDMIPLRATVWLVVAWFGLFALPLFFWVPDHPAPRGSAARGWRETLRAAGRQLAGDIRRAARDRDIGLFLLASACYRDGLNSLFAFGGIYAAGSFGMGFEEIILFAIALNVAAGIGAAAMGLADQSWGPKRTILLALVGLTGFGIPLLLVHTKLWFWILALGLGLFVGPAQSASRTLVTRLAPPDALAGMFGLFALTGKATAFLGPLLLGLATEHFNSQRAGMATIVLLFAAGLALLLPVREPPVRAPAGPA